MPSFVFQIKMVDEGRMTQKMDCEFRGDVWIISKAKSLVNRYLKSINLNKLEDLNIKRSDRIRNPRFSTLLFFDFFKKVD